MKPVCIIPARGGSKRIPGKNLRPFLGVPILKRVIDTALAWGGFDRIVVSSDSDDILSRATEWGAEAERRPEGLSGDDIWLEPVLYDFIRRMPGLWFCMLLPTAIFATAEVFKRAQELARADLPVVTGLKGAGTDAGQLYWVFGPTFLLSWETGIELRDFCLRFPIDAIDINTEEDWARAEAMFHEMRA